MTSERDEKHDKSCSEQSEAGAKEASEGSSKHRFPFLPAADDESSPLGSTDQHSDA